jgi:hypothetical protein
VEGHTENMWGYGADGKVIRYTLQPDRIVIQHPRCGFETQMTYSEWRALDTVLCPNCDLELASYAEWVAGIDQSLRESAEIEHRRARMHTRRHLLRTRERLLSD